ncbi:MAG: hypothetical protein DRP57_09045, partial [Spirochaetes bacterium]
MKINLKLSLPTILLILGFSGCTTMPKIEVPPPTKRPALFGPNAQAKKPAVRGANSQLQKKLI